jgi:type IV pilus assembly protein PilW
MNAPSQFNPSRQRGAGIVETMIGILIGMIVILVVYNVFAVSERYKRDTIGASDAQSTGLYAQFVLAREIANGGNGISAAMNNLFSCTNPALRPVPVLITDGGAANVSDQIQVIYSTAPRVNWPVFFVGASTSALYPAMTAPTDPFYVQSPNGFHLNDRLIVIGNPAANPGTGQCEVTTVTNSPVSDANGVVRINHGATALYNPTTAKVVNLGQVGDATQQTLFDVTAPTKPAATPCNASFLCQLRSTNLLVAGAAANPISQNIVLLKAQYGVDCNNNGIISWTPATANNLCGDPIGAQGTTGPVMYAPANVQAFDKWALRRIRAIRIGIVVRSDEPELPKGPTDPVHGPVNQSVVLFDCSTHNAACQGRVVLDNTLLTDYYRFRTYETVIPLRNPIWNWDPIIS